MTSLAEVFDLPFDEAIRFLRDKASVTTKNWTDVYGAAHSRALMVAGAATDALVDDFRREIDKALSQGTTLEEFRKGFDAIVAKHGWDHTGSRNWRSRVIFETNLRSAYAAGRYAQLTAPETLAVFPFWQYQHSGSKHPRLQHLAWDGLTLRADDPFWTTNYPPNGWHCGCFVIPSSQRDLRRQGKSGPDEAPERVFRAEEVGGVTRQVPIGVDPGFEWSPGQAWMARTMPGSATVAAAPGMIGRYVGATLAGSVPDGSWTPVAVLPENITSALDLQPRAELRLTARTIRTHVHHPEATAAYTSLPELAVETASVVIDDKGRPTALFSDPETGGSWVMGLTVQKDHARITTLHYSEPRKIRSIMRRGSVVRQGR